MCFYCVRNHWDGVYSCIWVCFWVDHRCFMRFPALWLFVSFTCFELWGIFLYCANPSIVALSALLLLVVQLSDVSVYLALDRCVYIHVISVKISFNAIPYFSFSVLLFVIGDLSPSLIENADCISQNISWIAVLVRSLHQTFGLFLLLMSEVFVWVFFDCIFD